MGLLHEAVRCRGGANIGRVAGAVGTRDERQYDGHHHSGNSDGDQHGHSKVLPGCTPGQTAGARARLRVPGLRTAGRGYAAVVHTYDDTHNGLVAGAQNPEQTGLLLFWPRLRRCNGHTTVCAAMIADFSWSPMISNHRCRAMISDNGRRPMISDNGCGF